MAGTKIAENGIWTWFNSPEVSVSGSDAYIGVMGGTDLFCPVVGSRRPPTLPRAHRR